MTPQKGEEEFKCGASCLFSPGFAKKKRERPREERDEDEIEAKEEERASRVAPLEKFGRASWPSSVILSGVEGGDCEDDIDAYFDLPLELIRVGGHGAHSPVNTAFVFDGEPKGVLRRSNSRSRRPVECSSRHVRFSTSSPMSSLPTVSGNGFLGFP